MLRIQRVTLGLLTLARGFRLVGGQRYLAGTT